MALLGRPCPLTPLEKYFREASGAAGYPGGFLEHYVMPLIYPVDLTRGVQQLLGGFVVLLNLAIYALVWRRRQRLAGAGER